MGYGTNRLAGYYMLFEAAGPRPAVAYNVTAFHSGRIGLAIFFYLHDDLVSTAADISRGGISQVNPLDSLGRYANCQIEMHIGTVPQAASPRLTTDPQINSLWDASHQGNGIAYAVLTCGGVGDPSIFTNIYPHNLPVLSIVADCTPTWDPRDPSQSRNDPASWTVGKNPVIQLIDYLTRADGGMGLDFDTVIAPNLSAWLVEANLCDERVDTATPGVQEPRYQSNGWFTFDNAPSDVIGGILSTCDGWLAEAGDGSLTVVVGVDRIPSDPPLTEKHIVGGFSLNYGQADEQMVNQLDISFTDPAQKYVTVQTQPWRDEVSISETGTVRSNPLELKWVQSNSQARRLASRAIQRLNPPITGSFVTSLYGLRYLGKRWIRVEYPFISGLQSCIIEIVQPAEVDLKRGRITWQFNVIGDVAPYNPKTDEGTPPVVPPSSLITQLFRENGTVLVREDGTGYNRENA